MYDAMLAETVTIRGDGGEEIEAYLARPMRQGPLGGVVVIHHMPGYDEPTMRSPAPSPCTATTR
jgi:carboxymethylenebutenolidase